MAQRSTHEATLISAINSGKTRSSHEALLISVTTPIMGIAYPLTPPSVSGIGPQDFTMREVNVVGETESPFSLNQQIQQWQGQRWELEITLPPMLYQQAEVWIAFLGALYGKYGTFLMGDYNRPTAQGALGGVPVATASNTAGLNTLSITGLTPSITNWAVAGDYVQLQVASNPQRLYKIVQNANSDVSGNATLQIFPNLRETVPATTAIVTSNCKGTFRLMDNVLPWKVSKDKVYTVSFKAKEAI